MKAMLRIYKKKPAALAAAAIFAAALAIPAVTASAAPSTAAECVQAGLVWVHVEFDGSSTGACAEKFDTAQAALLDTGLTTQTDDYVTEIAGRTATGQQWWSVYTMAPIDGAYAGNWDFAQVSLGQLELAASDVLAVVLQEDWELDALPPAVNPVEGVELGAEPTPKPTPAPSSTPEPSAAPEPTPTPTETPILTPGLPVSGV